MRVADQRPAPDWMREAAEIHTGDLRDTDEARRALAGCDRIVHLAAIVGGIANFHKLPYTLLEVNTALYNALFRAAIERQVERLVYVSSSMVFERAKEFPTREDYLERCPTPRSAYGFSKLAGEYWCRAAADEFGLRYSIVRPFNAYGPGEMPGDEPGIAHIVPDLIERALRRERPFPIFGSGEQTRTLTHIDDIARRHRRRAHARRRGGRGLQRVRRGRADGARDRRDRVGGVRQRPGRPRAEAPALRSTWTCSAAGRRPRRPATCSDGRRGSACARASPTRSNGSGASASRAAAG